MNTQVIDTLFKKLLSKLEAGNQSQVNYILSFIMKLQKKYNYYLDFIEECITPIIQKYILAIQNQTSSNRKIVPRKIQQISKIIVILYKQNWISKQSYLTLKQNISQIQYKTNRFLKMSPSILNYMLYPQLLNQEQNNRHIQGYDCLLQLTETNINESMNNNKTIYQYSQILSESLVKELNGQNYFQPSIMIPTQLSLIYHKEH